MTEWFEVYKADYSIPVGLTGETSELFLEKEHAKEFAKKHNLKLLRIEPTKLTEIDYKQTFNLD
ncbi:hypothetical protein QTG56_24410 (plasmid) [Rossellomorea sp. AcN35-11]|nr:hypothetical protein [Rossellomorea aquimaris]WJV31778.1 hypothetical protein QTG56_24410 [Rossellomorea sp. AcN35-11]